MSIFDFFSGIGSKDKKANSGGYQEKRTHLRVFPFESEKLFLNLLKLDGKEFENVIVGEVLNVSLRGACLKIDHVALKESLSVGQFFSGALNIEGFSVPLRVELVRFVKPDEVAFRFKPPFPKEMQNLEHYLEPRFLGASLREINRDALQEGAKENVRWFQGANETNLFCWEKPGTSEILKLQLMFLDQIVEVEDQKAPKTGVIRDSGESASESKKWIASEIINFSSQMDLDVIKKGCELIQSSTIPNNVKDFFINKIKTK